MSSTEVSVIFSYVLFIGFIGFVFAMGGPTMLENAPAPPVSPNYAILFSITSPNPLLGALELIAASFFAIIEMIVFVIAGMVYFVTLLGVTSIAYPWLGVLIGAYTAAVLYIVAGMAKPFGGK
jgi:hypothetical protein